MFGVNPCCLHLCSCVSFSGHFTVREADGKNMLLSACGCVCLLGCVISVVNGCSILITAGTSESHVPRPPPDNKG